MEAPKEIYITTDFARFTNLDKPVPNRECVKYIRADLAAPMIQWTGDNLREVVEFTGKSPKFGEWFKSWDEFERYVHAHGDIFKLFFEDGSHYEVPVGAWIVKTPDGYNVPSVARFVSSSTERQRRNANVCLSWKKFKDDESGVPALLVSNALIRRGGKYSTGFNIISGDEYILIRDIEAAIAQKPTERNEEQPEVDFETEYAKFSNDTDALDYVFPIDLADYKDFARHFCKVGKDIMKERALEWFDKNWREYIIGPDSDGCIGLAFWKNAFRKDMEE